MAALRPVFDRRLTLEFHRSRITSDAGLLAYRKLDAALKLTALADSVIADSQTGKNGWHGLIGLLRQSVYGRLAGYENVNDASRLGRDPAMRLPANRVLQQSIARLLSRPVGRPPKAVGRYHASFRYQGTKVRRFVAKVEWHGRNVNFQLAEVATPLLPIIELLQLIAGLRPRPAPT